MAGKLEFSSVQTNALSKRAPGPAPGSRCKMGWGAACWRSASGARSSPGTEQLGDRKGFSAGFRGKKLLSSSYHDRPSVARSTAGGWHQTGGRGGPISEVSEKRVLRAPLLAGRPMASSPARASHASHFPSKNPSFFLHLGEGHRQGLGAVSINFRTLPMEHWMQHHDREKKGRKR